MARVRVIPLRPASAMSRIRWGMLLSMASRFFDSNRYTIVGGMRQSIPPRSRNRSKLKCPVSPAKGTSGFGPLSAISATPQKKIPAKIIPAMTQASLLVIFLKAPAIAPPPDLSFEPLPDLVSIAGPEEGAAWVAFGLDIFDCHNLSAA